MVLLSVSMQTTTHGSVYSQHARPQMTSLISCRIYACQRRGRDTEAQADPHQSGLLGAVLAGGDATPSMAVPELHMTALTSAKSTLTRPGMVMMSEMPWTPMRTAGAPLTRCTAQALALLRPGSRPAQSPCAAPHALRIIPHCAKCSIPCRHADSAELLASLRYLSTHCCFVNHSELQTEKQGTCLSTSSARRKASCRGVDSPTTSSSLSLGITIRVSTSF